MRAGSPAKSYLMLCELCMGGAGASQALVTQGGTESVPPAAIKAQGRTHLRAAAASFEQQQCQPCFTLSDCLSDTFSLFSLHSSISFLSHQSEHSWSADVIRKTEHSGQGY